MRLARMSGIALLVLLCALSASANKQQHSYEIGLSERDWALLIAIPGFEVQSEQVRPNGQGKMMRAENKTTGVVLSVFVERESNSRSSRACRAYYWEKDLKSPIKKTGIRLSESGQMSMVEWMVREFGGYRVNQKNLKAFMARDDVCIDIHLSKVEYKPGDQELFSGILRTVRYRESSPAARASTTRPGTTAGEKLVRRYTIPGQGLLELMMPQSWRDSVRQSRQGLPTIEFGPTTGREFNVQVTYLWSPSRRRDFNSAKRLRPMVEAMGSGPLSRAVETTLELRELNGDSSAGYFFSLTDGQAKPGEYVYLTQGAVGVGDLLLLFTILTQTRDSEALQDGLTMLRQARHLPN